MAERLQADRAGDPTLQRDPGQPVQVGQALKYQHPSYV